ncbi:pre-mRNA-splicing factor SYF2-like [Oppia nitens]|uniref:pre-mRNA-splicing factor SYF2-like n=1 Tax=Oppia nitens TaxID=1686743 RepID=UPI0023DC8ECC|nr:pre-mRNA-splicing factor SYF2-like [Oppia nitens]
MSATAGSSASTSAVTDKRAERMKRLRELHQKRNEASVLNHKEVVEENKRFQLPDNWQKKQEVAQYRLNEELAKDKAREIGEDYERNKLLDIQADDSERWHRKRDAKHNPDPGFSDFEAATARQYNRLTKQMKPDLEEYQRNKEKMGKDLFYANQNTLIHGQHKDSKEAIDRMVDDLNNQIEKRSKYSRRRRFDDDADIDYINERNMKFNKKLDRFYGQYTQEIKQNLERGTAV